MAYSPTTWVNGTTPVNATNQNHLETQYTEASLSYNPDFFTAGFVLSGYAPSGTVGTNTLNVAAGTAYVLQSADNTVRQRKLSSSTQTTSTPSTTYHLYLQPDGTWYWSTSNSPAANSLWICDVATDGSGNISTVTDKRTLNATLLPNMAGGLFLPTLTNIGSGGAGTLSAKTLNLNMTAVNGETPSSVYFTAAANGEPAGKVDFEFVNQTGGKIVFFMQSANFAVGAGGQVAQLAGQATAGSLGVPVVVAQTLRQHITATGSTTIVTFTPTATGLYRASAYAMLHGANPSTISLTVTYTDPDGGPFNSNTFMFGKSSLAAQRIAAVSIATPDTLVAMSESFVAQSGQPISVAFNDATATPSDYVTAIIERLA